MKASKAAKPVFLNTEIDREIRKELRSQAIRNDETVPIVLHRILCESLGRMDRIGACPVAVQSD